jgi:hypothetical protein
MVALTYQRPYLYPKQLAAIFHDRRYGLIEASTKAGKTVACIVWLTEQALQGKAGHNFWWIAPSYNQAKIAFTRLGGSITRGTFTENKTDLAITLLNGAIIQFKTGETPDKLYGEDVYAAVVDEASRVRKEAWIALRSTITATGGPVRMIGNVRGRKNWFFEMCRRAEKGDSPNMHYAKLTVIDAIAAGVFKAEEAEDAATQMSESAYKELYMAEPSDDGGNPFGGDEAIDNCAIPEVLWSHEVVCWGWDLAKSQDWTVGIGLDSEGNVCRYYRWQKPWKETIADIRRLTGKVEALVDATGVGDPIVEDLQRGSDGRETNFKGFKFSASSKQQLMEGLAVGIQAQELGIPPGAIEIELKSFEYQYTRTGVRYSAPEGQHDDCVMALALARKIHHQAAKPAWFTSALAWAAKNVPVSIYAR